MSQPLPGFESTLRSRCFGTSQVLETGIYKMRGHTLNYLGLLIVKTPILKDFSMAWGTGLLWGPELSKDKAAGSEHPGSPSDARSRIAAVPSPMPGRARAHPIRVNWNCAALHITAGVSDPRGERPELLPSVRFSVIR